MTEPCAVDTCPAFAADGSAFCPGHKFAKKLMMIHAGRTCARCNGVLAGGDYVTRESTPDRFVHAMCPRDRSKPPRKGAWSTPLLTEEAAKHARGE